MGHHASALKCQDCPAKDKSIFCDLPNDKLDDVAKHKILNHYKKGQTLFVQGNPPYGVYCISQGNVKIAKIGSDGKESIVRVASTGDLLGHRSLFTSNYYMATGTAMEDTTVCFLDKKFVINLVAQNPSVSVHVIEKLSLDMGKAEGHMASLHQKNVRERLAELLLILKDSHGVQENNKWKLNIKLTREEMASMIGTANETLIRFMSEFKDEGIIEQDKKTIFISNEKKLNEWANLSL